MTVLPAVTPETVDKHKRDWHGCTDGCSEFDHGAHHARMHDDARFPPTDEEPAFGHTHEEAR